MNEKTAGQQRRRTAIAAGVAVFMMGQGSPAWAQEPIENQTVVVNGVRAALEQ